MSITPRFLDPLWVAEEPDGRWRLLRELRYDSAVLGARLVVPEGFVTDFSSIPQWALSILGSIGKKAGTVHDFLYSTRLTSHRRLADRVWPEALAAEGPIPAWKRAAGYTGLRIGGWRHW